MNSSDSDRPSSGADVTAAPSGIVEIILGILHCTMEGRDGVYVSAPITTGRRFVDWRMGPGASLASTDDGYGMQHRIHVVLPNREHVRPLVRRVRGHFGGVVIDPTALEDVPGWVQDDYHSLWTEVVEQCAHTVVFTDGWQYSSGCTREFLAAVRSGATLLREDLTPLDPHDGARLIEDVVNSIHDHVLPTAPLSKVLREVRLLLGQDRPVAPDAPRPR
jgi:hypothetical protein